LEETLKRRRKHWRHWFRDEGAYPSKLGVVTVTGSTREVAAANLRKEKVKNHDWWANRIWIGHLEGPYGSEQEARTKGVGDEARL